MFATYLVGRNTNTRGKTKIKIIFKLCLNVWQNLDIWYVTVWHYISGINGFKNNLSTAPSFYIQILNIRHSNIKMYNFYLLLVYFPFDFRCFPKEIIMRLNNSFSSSSRHSLKPPQALSFCLWKSFANHFLVFGMSWRKGQLCFRTDNRNVKKENK